MNITEQAAIDLADATVLITGGARGIGAATAAAFAAKGARVAIGDLDVPAADELPVGVRAYPLDVADEASFAAFVDAATDDLGPPDVLVNNAGIMPAGRFLDESARTTAAIFAVNVQGPIIGMRLVLDGMIERGRGHVVNVASGAGRFEIPGLATYCASKHAVVGLTGTVARELEGTGVTLTSVCPSAVHTELSSGIAFPFERVAKVTPEQVAAAIVASVHDRPREVMVPRWMGPYPPISQLLPSRLVRLVRRAVGDDRALTRVDEAARSAYAARLERQTSRETSVPR